MCFGVEGTEGLVTSSYESIALAGYSWTELNLYLVFNMEEITWTDLPVKLCIESL